VNRVDRVFDVRFQKCTEGAERRFAPATSTSSREYRADNRSAIDFLMYAILRLKFYPQVSAINIEMRPATMGEINEGILQNRLAPALSEQILASW